MYSIVAKNKNYFFASPITYFFQDLEKSSKVCSCWPHAELLINEDSILQHETTTSTPTTPPTKTSTTTTKPNAEKTTKSADSSADILADEKSTADIWTKCVNETVKLLIGGKTKLTSLYSSEPGRTAEIFGPDATEVLINLI